MCGILGSIDRTLQPALLASLHHRGPDGHDLKAIQVAGRKVWLGHTRLAILDLSPAGHQPMQSRDGRWWVSFNGELYNHFDLRRSLSGPFRGHSDTETLVELLAAQGMESTLAQLNGMFAFAALDCRAGQLYLARDPFGIKPLYYAREGRSLIFASEVRVLRLLGLGNQISDAGLRQFLSLRYVPSPATLWAGIQRLPPGQILRVDLESGGQESRRYIAPVRERFQGSFEEAVGIYRERLGAAIARQLLSDVPVGVLLSGGVDSALVAAMARDAGAEPPCFTVGFGQGHAECEIEEAAHTARALGLPFHSVQVTPESLREALPAIVRAVEEPLGTTSILPMWYLVARARASVTVVLTGQGTDEPWGGYFRYQVGLLSRALPFPWLFQPAAWLARFLPGLPDAAERGLRTLAQSDAAKQILAAAALFSPSERCCLLGDAEDGGAEAQIRAWLRWVAQAGTLSPVESMMRLDARMNLADDLLLYGDKIAMAHSLEARVPMLDLDLVQFVESLPIEYRIRWRQGKVLHKRMAEGYLPREIVHRPKKGFQVPFGTWSRASWKSWIAQHLLEGLEGILERRGVERLWRQHSRARPDRSRQIFSLLMLALWYQDQSHATG